MINEGLSRVAFFLFDRVTDLFPTSAPRVVQKILLGILGNRLAYTFYLMKYRRGLEHLEALDRILVVADLGIGDAIILQPAIEVFTRHFPGVQIDYLCNRSAGDLVFALPGAGNVFDIFIANGRLHHGDLSLITEIETRFNYSLIVNLCPFIGRKVWRSKAKVLDLYVPFAAYIIRMWRVKAERMHVSSALVSFLEEFLSPLALSAPSPGSGESIFPRSPLHFGGNSIYLSDGAIDIAKRFLVNNRLFLDQRLVFFNPDTSSRFTRIPFEVQIRILREIVESNDVGAVLLGVGFSSPGIEQKLLSALPTAARDRVTVVPPLPLHAYAAIIDACDMFVSGDGGPLHVAAAWRRSISGRHVLRNRTAVVSVFGATDSRMYGYDSERPDHVAANQLAPSKVFVSEAPCRNITCINKLGKTCRDTRCFSGIEAGQISAYINSYFSSMKRMRYSV
jgi:ADP-heptose:LPS heptosyltransferase